MTVKSYSAFSYGHDITVDNFLLPFSEDNITEILGELRLGGYTIGDLASEMARAMNELGTLNYISTVDRTTGIITISGDSNFYLYVTSSANSPNSAYPELGFTTERSGASSYVSDERAGELFQTQFKLQKYVDFINNQKASNVTVNESATGKIQVVKYNDLRFMQCNITLQTNIPQGKGSIVRSRNGYDELLAFMQYAVSKNPMEFYRDEDDPENTVTEVLLESTPADSKGTGYKLVELYSRGFADWWETGTIKFREIN